MLVPISFAAVLAGFPALLGLYSMLASVCLVSASLRMLITLQVVRLVGAKQAKLLVQILGALLGFVVPMGSLMFSYWSSANWSVVSATEGWY